MLLPFLPTMNGEDLVILPPPPFPGTFTHIIYVTVISLYTLCEHYSQLCMVPQWLTVITSCITCFFSLLFCLSPCCLSPSPPHGFSYLSLIQLQMLSRLSKPPQKTSKCTGFHIFWRNLSWSLTCCSVDRLSLHGLFGDSFYSLIFSRTSNVWKDLYSPFVLDFMCVGMEFVSNIMMKTLLWCQFTLFVKIQSQAHWFLVHYL